MLDEFKCTIGEKNYRETPKFLLWLEFYSNYKNKRTFHNQTQSAIYAYNLDPKRQYNWACVSGSRNIRKAKVLISKNADLHGFTYGKLLDLYFIFMLMHNDISMLSAIAKDMNIELPYYTPVTTQKIKQQKLNIRLDNLSELQLQVFTDLVYDYVFNYRKTGENYRHVIQQIYKYVRKNINDKKHGT